MIELHPEILKKNGRNEFVVLPYEEYAAIEQFLQDAEDLLDLREAKRAEEHAPGIGWDDVKKELGL